MAYEGVNKGFLGTGFKFPVQVDENTGMVKTSSFEEDIEESIGIILGTQPGERPMSPYFGCPIHAFVFSTMDYTTLSMIEKEVVNSLIMWEPRIKDIEAHAAPSPSEDGLLLIEISYTVRSTNNPFNLVYPYYISEGYGDAAKGR